MGRTSIKAINSRMKNISSWVYRRILTSYVCIILSISCLSLLSCRQCISNNSQKSTIDHESSHPDNLQLNSKARLIAESSIPLPEFPGVYQGIAYSDSGNQLMIWSSDGNILIYNFVNDKLALNSETTYTVNQDILWQPDGMSTESSEKKCVWYPSLSFYNSLIKTAYNPPPAFNQLGSFLNNCRRIHPYASAIVGQYCKGLEHNDFSGVLALAYDNQRRLTPIISFYNEPRHKSLPNTGVSSSLLGESLDMNTLAYFYESSADYSAEHWQKIIFYRHLKPWREYSLSDFGANDGRYQMAPCCVSAHGNLACLVLYKFPSYGRHIGSSDWFKSIFRSHRKDVIIIVLDTQTNRIIQKEEISGFLGVEKQLVWRAAFCERKREFVMLNVSTGVMKRYRY